MFHVRVAEELRNQGYNVVRASETGHTRADDRQILEKSISEDRVLVTLDEDFGDWAVLPLKEHPGVIRIRANPTTSKNIVATLLPFLRQYKVGQFKNHLVILSSKRAKWIRTA
jgi:predicted nuclease of predicted toxin-antitoxin system